jgi:hypothetical protein
MPNAIEQIYNQLVQVFGGTNPNQFFTMLMPSTTLDQATYAYDTTSYKPALVAEAESRLVDQMFDVSKVSGSSNGQRLSSQYMQALSVLVPQFDPKLADVKNNLRDYINSSAPANAKVGDQPFTGSLQEYYFALYERWLKFKSDWEKKILDYKQSHTEEQFLEWFESIADGELAQIDAARGEILSVFSPTDMEAILGALEVGPGGEMEEALSVVNDIRVPSPSGGYNYPIDLVPDNWFLDLASDMNPVDLLQDPEFIAITISARRQAILASISQIQSLLSQVPSTSEMKQQADALTTSLSDYTNAQNNILNAYTDNTATAIEMYLSHAQSDSVELTGLTQDFTKVNSAISSSEQSPSKKTSQGSTALTTEDISAVVTGQKKLVTAQSKLLQDAQALAAAGMNLSSAQAKNFGDLPVILARLQAQLNDLNNMREKLATSSAAAANRLPAPALLSRDTFKDDLKKASTQIRAAVSDQTKNNTADLLITAINDIITSENNDTVKSLLSIVTTKGTDAENKAKAETGASSTSILKEVTTAIEQALQNLPCFPTQPSTKSGTSERFMTMQLSFSTDEMTNSSSSDSQFNQSSWSVDLFFGSASGQSSQSSSVSCSNSFDQNTAIEIGLKAAKVDISRGWFDPGLFKLSTNMNRLSSTPVSTGGLANENDWNDPNKLKKVNNAILPCFPVAFVVAKDVSIRFQVSQSSLSAVKSVVDSRSASGGGFLCFSASSSSASHSENSNISSKTEGTVITINMPGPQILGWFMEFTPPDKSTPINDTEENTITHFVNELKNFNPSPKN